MLSLVYGCFQLYFQSYSKLDNKFDIYFCNGNFYSPQRESKTALDFGFYAVDYGFQVLYFGFVVCETWIPDSSG